MNDIMHDGTPDGIWNSQDHPSGLPDSGPVSSAGTGAESATARQDVRKIRENVARELAAANDQLMAKNHALAQALSRAGKELTKAKAQLSQMAQPPKTFATMVKVDSSMTDELGVQHASAEILTGGRRLVVPVAANVNASRLTAGAACCSTRTWYWSSSAARTCSALSARSARYLMTGV